MNTPPNTENLHQVQNLLYTISIYEDDTVLTDHKSHDKQFLVSQEQLMGFFRSEITFAPERNLLWMKTDGLSTTYLYHLPKRSAPRTITVRRNKKDKQYAMQFPGLIFQVRVSEDRLSNLHVWAYAGRLRETSILYEVPLPNISGHSVCLGGVNKELTRNQSVLDKVQEVFFDTPFNSHSFHVSKDHMPFTEFYEKYQGAFPWNKLNKLCRAKSILDTKKTY